ALDPVGRQIRLADLPYTVIGVAEKQGSFFGNSLDQFIIVPIRSPARRLIGRSRELDAVVVQSPTDDAMRVSMEAVRELMRSRHKLRATQPDDFTLETSDSALEFVRR